MIARFKSFRSDETGATAIEYALIAGFISTAIVGTLSAIGPLLVEKYRSVVVAFGG